MKQIEFLLNGNPICVENPTPDCTLLDWLRETRNLTGTKEGCNEGDCGACTIMVTDRDGTRALNSCILFLPQLHGKAVRTVEGLRGPEGETHPVQDAMVAHHGSQCGFCTPGFVMSMATAQHCGQEADDDTLAGNLCRCTGYAPIIRAAKDVGQTPSPAWMADDLSLLQQNAIESDTVARPKSSDALATWYEKHPTATLIGGATDVGLWVTKQLRDLGSIAFLNGALDLKEIHKTENGLQIGAAATMTDVLNAVKPLYPSFAEMLRRFASLQIRNAATLGGNIANGSPIGDSPPALIALGASLHLRKGQTRRTILLEDFFLEYGKQDRAPGEFVEAITIPHQPDALRCYKLSKRFDQDISAICGCFSILIAEGRVSAARIAFGGMAGTPCRATHVENALLNQPWNAETIATAKAAFTKDYTPLSDMRASAEYRIMSAQNMLERYFSESMGLPTDIHEVSA
ncbi:xanthine dehydrogenase small subunit [Cochlodiniinecator piscidefendens]|uniref:xanthine dehydrogenase small subunit n=1 Tax=Cochlodiniinecator piscidefendens TaxID=2715756 RepID=UPI00140E5469|nr:xanthine dehydrogenase small subunit [Cochlodiniinecator piscidefendens]